MTVSKPAAALCLFVLVGFHALLPASPLLDEPIRPIPGLDDQDPERVALGRHLFFSTELSADRSVSCASCHQPALGGTDREVPSRGAGGAAGNIKTPSVFNSRFNIAQFWDGRASSLEEQLDGPIHNPGELASSWPDIIARLKKDRAFYRRFRKTYPDGMNERTLKDALVAFERSLITPDSPFDRWLQGEEDAISPQVLEGYRLFKAYGCIACHQGVNVGGNLFQRMGLLDDYFRDRGGPLTRADLGRFNVTGYPEDRFYFKVPSLRLAALQRRFFHDGSAASLDEAIRVMGNYQAGREIPPRDRTAIAAFLASLVGKHPLLDATP